MICRKDLCDCYAGTKGPLFVSGSQQKQIEKSKQKTEAFDQRADFGELANAGMYIKDVLQQSRIILNDRGGEAASATVVVMDGANLTPPSDILADRPFIFTIYEKTSGALVFIGQKVK